jgi:SWI/SNF related-matrix-associated actin-dependent regulator of chromatin subfamily C
LEDSDVFNEWMNEEDYEMKMTEQGHWISVTPTNGLMKRKLFMSISAPSVDENEPVDSLKRVKRKRSNSPVEIGKKRKRGTVTRRIRSIQDDDE